MRFILFLTSFMTFSTIATAGIYDNIDGAEWVDFHKEGLGTCPIEFNYKPELGICMADLAKTEICSLTRRGSLPESYTASQEEFYNRECRELCAIAHIGWGHLANSVRENLVKFIKKSCKRKKTY